MCECVVINGLSLTETSPNITGSLLLCSHHLVHQSRYEQMQLKSFYFHFLCVTSVPTVVHIFSQAYYFSHKHGKRSLLSYMNEKKTSLYFIIDLILKGGCLNCSINKDHSEIRIRWNRKQVWWHFWPVLRHLNQHLALSVNLNGTTDIWF